MPGGLALRKPAQGCVPLCSPRADSALRGVSLSLPSLETWSLLGPAQAHRTGLSLPPNPGSPLSLITPCHSSPFGEEIILPVQRLTSSPLMHPEPRAESKLSMVS